MSQPAHVTSLVGEMYLFFLNTEEEDDTLNFVVPISKSYRAERKKELGTSLSIKSVLEKH